LEKGKLLQRSHTLAVLILTFSFFAASISTSDVRAQAQPNQARLILIPPAQVAGEIGELFDVVINVSDVEDLRNVELTVSFNTSLLDVTQVLQESFFPPPPKSDFRWEVNESLGLVKFNVSLANSETSITGNGTIALIAFEVVQGPESCVSSPICIQNALLLDSASNSIIYDSVGAVYFWRSMRPDPPVGGRALDVYTQKGGIGPDEPGGQFVTGELVYLISRVTYNNDPVQRKLVAFEVINPLNESTVLRAAETDEDGFASVTFRTPNLPSSNGTWTAISVVDIGKTVVWDTVSFQVVFKPPVGGYSSVVEEHTLEKPLTTYLLLLAIVTAFFTVTKRKRPKELGRKRCICAVLTLMIFISISRFNVSFQTGEGNDLQITNFYACDASGIPQDYFPKKTTAYFNVSVGNTWQEPKNISLWLTVQDELEVPIGTDQLNATISQDASTYYIMSVFIPKWAYVGVATAYASLREDGSPVDTMTTNLYIGPEDLTPPTVHISSPQNTTYDTEPLPLIFTINERTTRICYSLNGLENMTIDGNTTLTGLANGQYRIVVYATDNSGNTGSSEQVYFTILIVHDVAVVDLRCSSTVAFVGQVVSINVTVLNQGTMIETFGVTAYANSSAIETLMATNLSPNNRETFVFTWNTIDMIPGNYTIKAIASTVLGETDTADNTYIDGYIRIVKPPVSYFTFSPTVLFTGEITTFNASLSTPDGGIIISYDWDFGDETPNTTGMIATHAYTDNGTYTVTLAVTDSDGLTDTYSQNVTVLNRHPIASFTESASTVLTGTIIHFNASNSFDPDGLIVACGWDFGDGDSGSDLLVDHSYAKDGVYNVTLTVMDDDGASSMTSTIETVLDRPPVASFTKTTQTVYVNELIHFNGSTSYDPDGTIVAYFWDFGDGTNATGVTVDHGYEHNGTYTATLTVTDDDGMSASTNTTENVTTRPDIQVSNVWSSKTVLGQGYSLEINVTVTNRGDRVETFDVTVYAGVTPIATQTITLSTGSTISIAFVWNSTGFPVGNYTISAYSWPIGGETETADNRLEDGWVVVTIPGDADGDFKVKSEDLMLLLDAFGSTAGPDGYFWHTAPCVFCPHNSNCDINCDGRINLNDIVILLDNFGKTYP
jgi:PKD repeat protein